MKTDDLVFELQAVVGKVSLPSISQLKVGDILVLAQKISQPVNLEINGKRFFVALPGLNETNKAVKIIAKV